MTVSVKVDLDGVHKKLGPVAMDRGRYALANQMLADMNQFVPRKEGTLRQTGHVLPQNSGVAWNTPYARAQFYGTNGRAVFRKYSTPGTGKRWDLKAEGMYLDSWKRTFVRGAGI